MHYTGTLYRNPYVPESPLLEVTQGCSHNRCRFCTMYRNVKFTPSPMEWVEADLREIARRTPDADRLQLVGADPFCLPVHRLREIAEKAHEHLPQLESICMAARVTNVMGKSQSDLEELRALGIDELFIGTESGDDWTLRRIEKGYAVADIIEQSAKLDAAGIRYWHTFLNGVAGAAHGAEHAENTARIFNETHPLVVGTGALVLFPRTPLAQEAACGTFDPQTEKGLLRELRLFLENLECDSMLITHHTHALNLNGPFLANKQESLRKLDYAIETYDEEIMAHRRAMKVSL